MRSGPQWLQDRRSPWGVLSPYSPPRSVLGLVLGLGVPPPGRASLSPHCFSPRRLLPILPVCSVTDHPGCSESCPSVRVGDMPQIAVFAHIRSDAREKDHPTCVGPLEVHRRELRDPFPRLI